MAKKEKYIRKVGNKYYIRLFIKDVNGLKKQRDFPAGETLEEARQERLKLLLKYSTEEYKKEQKIMFYDLIDMWTEQSKLKLREHTFIKKQALIKVIKNNIKNKDITKITKKDIQQLLNKFSTTSYKKTYIKLLLSNLTLIFNYAIDILEVIEINPCKKLIITGADSNKKRAYTKEEYEEIKKYLSKFRTYDYQSFFIIGIKTGMRFAEMLALKWNNVDFNNKKISIENGSYFKGNELILSKTKNSHSVREIYVDNEVIEILKNIKKKQLENEIEYDKFYNKTNFIFQLPNGNPLTPSFKSCFRTNIKKICDISSPIHSMRHTHISWLLEAGANIKTVQNRVGHSNVQTTLNIYTHINEKMKKDIENYLVEF